MKENPDGRCKAFLRDYQNFYALSILWNFFRKARVIAELFQPTEPLSSEYLDCPWRRR
jgi:hypothetical protein